MASLLAFAGADDSPSPGRVYPLAPGGIKYRTFQPPSYKSDYLLSMDFPTTPLRKPDAIGGYGSWLDDLLGDAGSTAVSTATDTVTASLVAQIPTITAAVVASPAFQAQVTQIKTQAILGGLVLGALVVGGVWAVTK